MNYSFRDGKKAKLNPEKEWEESMLAKKNYTMPLIRVVGLSCNENVLLTSLTQWSEKNDFDGADPGNWVNQSV